jgi:hypothetical protein
MRTALTLPVLGAALVTAGALVARSLRRVALLERLRARGF